MKATFHNTLPHSPRPETELSDWQRSQLTAELNTAIFKADRLTATRIQAQLRGLRPVTFPEGARPKHWHASKARYGSPRHVLHGMDPKFLDDEVRELADKPVVSPSKYLMDQAGIEPPKGLVVTPTIAGDAYVVAKLADQVGTYHIDEETRGVSYRTPDGDLHSFRLPGDPARQELVQSVFAEANYRPNSELPLVITADVEQNRVAFADQS